MLRDSTGSKIGGVASAESGVSTLLSPHYTLTLAEKAHFIEMRGCICSSGKTLLKV
jgi:hypothetical protein